mmetsp:Transcript_4749/g.9392  ORF Transcript_4749/g.9392 Transcript_4749/m.9392 type:complete len:83 (+) Transcript_4749:128-376(+)
MSWFCHFQNLDAEDDKSADFAVVSWMLGADEARSGAPEREMAEFHFRRDGMEIEGWDGYRVESEKELTTGAAISALTIIAAT